MLAGGCQRYERRPLDLAAHRAEFLARSPDSIQSRFFAAWPADQTASPTAAYDLSDGIGLEEAEAIAMVFNADLRLARLRAGVARAAADSAGLWQDPVIGVDLTRIIESVAHPWKVMAAVGLTIPVSGRLEIEKQRAGLSHVVELARVAEAEWRVRVDLRREWIRRAGLAAQVEATNEFLSRITPILDIVDTMERAGELPRTEAQLLRIEHTAKQSELAVLASQEAESELGIRRLMGLSPVAPVALVPGMIRRDTTAANRRSESLESAPEHGGPLMLIAAAEYEVAEKELELEVRKQYPDLTIGPGYGHEDGNNEVLLGLSLPLPILNGNRQGIAEAGARRDLARAVAETTLERLLSEWHVATVRYRAAVRHREMMEHEIVPLVDAQYSDTHRLARLGEINTFLLLESMTRRHDAAVKLIEALREESLAEVRLQELEGPGAGSDPVSRHDPESLTNEVQQ